MYLFIFFIQRTLLSLPFLTQAPFFQANNISLLHPQKHAHSNQKMSPITTKCTLYFMTCQVILEYIDTIENTEEMSKN